MDVRIIGTPALAVLSMLIVIAGPCGTAVEQTGEPDEIRFVLQVDADVQHPVLVQLTDDSDQPGWVTVTHAGERIHLSPRCEIEDCDRPVATCGAAIPIVRNLTAAGGERQIAHAWDGAMSVVSADGCELRQAAPAGAYVARFCHAREADGMSAGAREGQGTVRDPMCTEVPFTLPRSDDVVFRVAARAP